MVHSFVYLPILFAEEDLLMESLMWMGPFVEKKGGFLQVPGNLNFWAIWDLAKRGFFPTDGPVYMGLFIDGTSYAKRIGKKICKWVSTKKGSVAVAWVFTLQCDFCLVKHPVLVTTFPTLQETCLSPPFIVDKNCLCWENWLLPVSHLSALMAVLSVLWSPLPSWHVPFPFHSSGKYLTAEWAAQFSEQIINASDPPC